VRGPILSRTEIAMSKILLGAAVIAATALAGSSAYAMGGGNSSPWASPYAILEPQTVAPYVGDYSGDRSRDIARERRGHLTHRHATPEQ
jgi:hypothetical protein